MAATGKRKITVTFFGDLGGPSPGLAQDVVAADNVTSPAQVQVVTLAAGDNTITAPGAGTVPTACTIMKPSGNTSLIKLKGNAGDTGVKLHLTDPDAISIDPSQASFILNAAAQIVGVRLFWT